jgi:hypothetical protein
MNVLDRGVASQGTATRRFSVKFPSNNTYNHRQHAELHLFDGTSSFLYACKKLITYLPSLTTEMLRYSFVAFAALAACQSADELGAQLDAPMLRGGRPNGPGAMLRFGCSQVVIERLDP